jgi:hypothetical protein
VLSVGPGARQFSPFKDVHVGKRPPVGNIHYQQLPGYRLEVKTAGSGVSSQPNCGALALVVREFLISLGWNSASETCALESIEEMDDYDFVSTAFGRLGGS